MKRDFTYIDDIVSGIISAIENNYSCEVFNLGNNHSEELMDMVQIIEKHIGQKAEVEFLEMQPGDVKATFADIDYSNEKLSYNPKIRLSVGIPKFIEWYKGYHLK